MKEDNLEVKTYKQIKNMMLNFELVPGQRIVITELADQLGVSRTPVKMALIMLLKEGYLDYSTRQSYYTIHQFSKEELDYLFEFRVFIELGAIEKIIDNLTDEKLDILDSKAITLKEAAAKDERELRFLLDQDFHSYIVELSGNPYLVETHRDLYQRFFMRRKISNYYGVRYAEMLHEHDDIVAAFRERNVQKIRNVLESHLLAGKKFIDSIYF
jgi:DNA-binding GntR family transcriptional regulator